MQTAGQVRSAIGAALVAIGKAYPLVNRVNSDVAGSLHRELESVRKPLEQWYAQLQKTPGGWSVAREWSQKRRLVDRAYHTVAGVEAAADWTPTTSNWTILADSIAEAPGVALQTAGKAVGAVAKEAGNAAGGLLGGVFSGLGPMLSVVLVAVAVFYLRAKVRL